VQSATQRIHVGVYGVHAVGCHYVGWSVIVQSICLERFVTTMTCYVSGETLTSAH